MESIDLQRTDARWGYDPKLPLAPSLSPIGGEGARRGGEGALQPKEEADWGEPTPVSVHRIGLSLAGRLRDFIPRRG